MAVSGNDGKDFERRVEAWLKKRCKASNSKVRHRVNGLSVKFPYEIDVWINISRRTLKIFGEDIDVWVECKARKAAIKRKDVAYLVGKARDVYQAVLKGRERLYFNRLMIVSMSRFDSDAIELANQQGVSCYRYDGKSYIHENSYDCDQEPGWLNNL